MQINSAKDLVVYQRAYELAKAVSPPVCGMIFEHSAVPSGGASRKVSSVCHTSVGAGGLPSLLS